MGSLQFSRIIYSVAALVLCALWLIPVTYAIGLDAEQRHSDALALANNADYVAALQLLEQLAEDHPTNNKYYFDYIAVLGWAEHDAQVVEQIGGKQLKQFPIYVLAVVAKSARNLKDYTLATQAYHNILSQDSQNKDAKQGLLLTLIDAGQYQQALQQLTSVNVDERDVSWLQTQAYLAKHRGNDMLEQLRINQQILMKDPDNQQAQRETIRIAYWLGAPHLANRLAQQHPNLVDNDELSQIHADIIAYELRWLTLAGQSQKNTRDKAEKLSQRIEQHLAMSNLTPTKHQAAQRDLMLAYSYAGRYKEVTLLYQQLTHEQVAFNAIELDRVGGSFLRLHKPDIAIAVYQQAHQLDRHNFDVHVGLAYSLLENEQYEDAIAFIDDIIILTYRRDISNSRQELTSLLTISSLMRASAGYFHEAESSFEYLLSKAPFNMSLQNEAASLKLWQGLPRHAEKRLTYILNVEPENSGAMLGMLESKLQTYQFSQAHDTYQQASLLDLDDRQRQQLERVWGRYDHYHFAININRHFGNASNNENADLWIDSRLYLKPFQFFWRPFVRGYYTQAQLQDGLERHERAGAGIEFRRHSLTAQIELSNRIQARSSLALRTDLGWQVNDYWSIGAITQSDSESLSLRARKIGIEAQYFEANTTLRFSDYYTIGGVSSFSNYSDNNLRGTFNTYLNIKIINKPRFVSYLRFDAYTSRNTKTSTDYFNPIWDASLTSTLTNTWTLYRHYDNRFSHSLSPYLGFYKQDNNPALATGGVEYRQNFSYGQSVELDYGLRYARPVYDGHYEKSILLFASLSGRF